MSDYQFGVDYKIHPYHFGSLAPHQHLDYVAQLQLPFPSRYPSPVQYADSYDECVVAFVISAVLLSISGAFLGGAAVNLDWSPKEWNWNDPHTPVGILNGAVGGILLPYAFFYSNSTLGIKGTVTVTLGGAYLGAAMMNKQWNLLSWNWTSPTTYYGAFQGMQTALWLIDATSSITAFTDEVNLQGWPRGAFIALTYGTGVEIAYHYVSQYHDGNYVFWEWDRVHEPGTLFAVIDGIESGTRLPVGFAEIGRDLANRTAATVSQGSSVAFHMGEETFENIDPWSIFGAGFMGFLYASEEEKNFDFTKWNWGSVSTVEAILNGIVYGKDLPEMVTDVKSAFRFRQQKHYEKPPPWPGSYGWMSSLASRS